MARFCKKCGSRLDAVTGLCPVCSATEAQPGQSQTRANVGGAGVTTAPKCASHNGRPANAPVTPHYDEGKGKANSQLNGKTKKAKGNKKKNRNIVLKIVAVFLAAVILIGVGFPVLVYFDLADSQFVSSVFNTIGIAKDEDTEWSDEFRQLTGKFTGIKITDENSAISAAKDATDKLGLGNGTDELTAESKTSVGGFTYYRLQQNYSGIPVLGRELVVVADSDGNAKGITSNALPVDTGFDATYSFDKEKVTASVKDYLKDYSELSNVSISAPSADNVCIYSFDDAAAPTVVYKAMVSFSSADVEYCTELMIDLKDSSVLYTVCDIYEEKCYNADGTKSFNGAILDNGKYIMKDTDRNIYIFNAGRSEAYRDNGPTIEYVPGVIQPVESDDRFFGNVQEEKDAEYDRAFLLLENIIKVYDYYYNNYGEIGRGAFVGIYNDMYDDGGNALGGAAGIDELFPSNVPEYFQNISNTSSVGIISMGVESSDFENDALATLCHEYTHVVTRSHVRWQDVTLIDGNDLDTVIRYNEAGAINEGYSDLFAIIMASNFSGNNIDWTMKMAGTRNAANPEEFGYPSTVLDGEKHFHYVANNDLKAKYYFYVLDENKNQSNADYSHRYATVITHAGYLMNTGVGGTYTALNTKELSDLWYHTMLTLPANCTYTALRENMEMSAEIIGLSSNQQQCVAAALDEVGIEGQSSTTKTYSNEVRLSAYDRNGDLYDDYTIDITGKEYTGLFKTGFFKKDYSNQIRVRNSDSVALNLSRGEYTAVVTDNYDSSRTKSVHFKISGNSKNKELAVYTDFGFDYTLTTGAEMYVFDMNDRLYHNYSVKIDGNSTENGAYTDEFTVSGDNNAYINVNEGKYKVTVTDGMDSSKTKSISVKVNSTGVSSIKLATDFGKKSGAFEMHDVPTGAVEYNGHYYYLYSWSNNVDWQSANEYCEDSNGYLVTITDEGEQAFIQKYIADYAESLRQEQVAEQGLQSYDGARNIVDRADLLSDSERTKLEAAVADVHDKYDGFDVAIITTDNCGKLSLEEYTEKAYSRNNFGNNCAILSISLDDREWYCSTYGSAFNWLDQILDDMDSTIAPMLTDGKYADAFKLFVDKCKSYLGTPTVEDIQTPELTIWIGANDYAYEGAWEWSNGEKFEYSNWATGQPDNYSWGQDYAIISNGKSDGYGTWLNEGEWDDIDYGCSMFICEWGEYTPEADVFISPEPNIPIDRVTSDERDIVLVLDVSGSMGGTPLEQTKSAAADFVDTVLNEDASIAVVSYDNSAYLCSDFSVNKEHLTGVINDLSSGGSTNIEAGLSMAQSLLESSRAKKKIIVLMSDGMPNEGKWGEDLIEYADTLKEAGSYIYALGFFESLSGNEKASAQALMEGIGSEGLHYEVANADDLVFFFGDVADQINGQQYIYIRIACPVDVIVKHGDEIIDSGKAEDNVRVSFGSLTFEEKAKDDENDESSDDKVDDRIKVLRLKADAEYDIRIEGTGRGKMSYTIGYADDEGNYSDFRKFSGIKITKNTVITTDTHQSTKTILEVDEDGDGIIDLRYMAKANERGSVVKQNYVGYIVIAASALVVAVTVLIIIKKALKKRAVRKTEGKKNG